MILTIKCKKDYKSAHDMLKLYNTFYEKYVLDGKNEALCDYLKEAILDIKHEMRAYAGKDANITRIDGHTFESRIVKQSDDSYIELICFADAVSIDDAEECYYEYIYRECRPSMYDCTGQLFSRWHKMFKRNGKYYAYHSVGIDV